LYLGHVTRVMRYMCVYHLANGELGQLNYSVRGIKTN